GAYTLHGPKGVAWASPVWAIPRLFGVAVAPRVNRPHTNHGLVSHPSRQGTRSTHRGSPRLGLACGQQRRYVRCTLRAVMKPSLRALAVLVGLASLAPREARAM